MMMILIKSGHLLPRGFVWPGPKTSVMLGSVIRILLALSIFRRPAGKLSEEPGGRAGKPQFANGNEGGGQTHKARSGVCFFFY